MFGVLWRLAELDLRVAVGAQVHPTLQAAWAM